MATHSLKTEPRYFDAVLRGDKTFELRKNDRRFAVGDLLVLEEYARGLYTGRTTTCLVTYVLHTVEQFGLTSGYAVLSIRLLENT